MKFETSILQIVGSEAGSDEDGKFRYHVAVQVDSERCCLLDQVAYPPPPPKT